MTGPRNRAWAAVATVALIATLGACSSGKDAPAPDGTGGATESAQPQPPKDPEQIALEAEEANSIGTPQHVVKGKLATTGAPKFAAELTVLKVEADENSTELVFALRNTSGKEQVLNPREMNDQVPLMGGVRDVSITDAGAQRVLLPFLAFPKGKDPITTSFCACSDGPLSLDQEWMVQNATFPPLDPGTTSVSAKIATFDEVEDIPVTWK